MQRRRLADHAGTDDLLDVAVAVGDDPLAADELHALAAGVRDADVVGEEVVVLARLAALADVFALHFDADPARDGLAHLNRWKDSGGGLNSRIRGQGTGNGAQVGAQSARTTPVPRPLCSVPSRIIPAVKSTSLARSRPQNSPP